MSSENDLLDVFSFDNLLSLLALSSLISLLLLTCTKPAKTRPSKDIPPPPARSRKEMPTKSSNNNNNNAKSDDKLEPSPTSSKRKIKTSKETTKPKSSRQQHHSSRNSSARRSKNPQQQPSTNAFPSKELIEANLNSPDKKFSAEKPSSAENQKKSNFKGGSADEIKQSEHIDTELRKQKNLTNTTVTKGSHEILVSKSKEKCSKVLDDCNLKHRHAHRGHTPAHLPEDEEKEKQATVSKVDFNKSNFGTDDEGLFKKPTDVESSEDKPAPAADKAAAEDKSKKQKEKEKEQPNPKPQKFNKTDKQKKIDAGAIRKASDYPTMADVVSDWTSEKELEAKKKKGEGKKKDATDSKKKGKDQQQPPQPSQKIKSPQKKILPVPPPAAASAPVAQAPTPATAKV